MPHPRTEWSVGLWPPPTLVSPMNPEDHETGSATRSYSPLPYVYKVEKAWVANSATQPGPVPWVSPTKLKFYTNPILSDFVDSCSYVIFSREAVWLIASNIPWRRQTRVWVLVLPLGNFGNIISGLCDSFCSFGKWGFSGCCKITSTSSTGYRAYVGGSVPLPPFLS